MFYVESDINGLKIWPLCTEELNDPRLLPCGQTTCHECVIKKIDSESSMFECSNCTEQHKMPEKGFFKNEIAASLVKKTPDEIFRSQKVEEFKALLKSLKSKSEALTHLLKNSEHNIKEHCSEIKNDDRKSCA